MQVSVVFVDDFFRRIFAEHRLCDFLVSYFLENTSADCGINGEERFGLRQTVLFISDVFCSPKGCEIASRRETADSVIFLFDVEFFRVAFDKAYGFSKIVEGLG